MERSIAVIAALLLAGCATKPLPEIRTVEVQVAAPVACLKPEDVPTRPAKLGPLPADQAAALSLVLSKLLEWTRGYGVEADGKLKACAR